MTEAKRKSLPRGLYAVTPDDADTARLVGLVRAALRGGAAILQYRNKSASASLRQEQARALLPLCRAAAVPLIINDDLELALAIDADGLHLGAQDGDLADARARLGAHQLLGASCYDRLDLAIAAHKQGVDHVAFGSLFDSTTKPHAKRASLELFAQARERTGLAAVAIGGITLANAPIAIAAGAHAVAVIQALFSAPDVGVRAREFSQLFSGR